MPGIQLRFNFKLTKNLGHELPGDIRFSIIRLVLADLGRLAALTDTMGEDSGFHEEIVDANHGLRCYLSLEQTETQGPRSKVCG